MKFVFELTLEEQDKICNEHYLNWNGCCGTCPLRIDGNICVRDLCDDKTSLRETVTKLLDTALKEIDINDYIRMDKTEVGDKGESRERK